MYNSKPVPVVSCFFVSEDDDTKTPSCQVNVSDDFLFLLEELNFALERFQKPSSVESTYNPTIYARPTFEMFIRKYCSTRKQIMYFGMNPGPWGMSQTGVPFGEVNLVRDWLSIKGPVGKPPKEINARPVKGFECTRSEISGKRFWGLFKDLCGTPENFFRTSFVYNYLPEQWMKSNGCNLTPSDFKAEQMKDLYDICDPIFVKVVQLYEVSTIVAIGKFCELRAVKALNKYLCGSAIQVFYMPHPSPRVVNNNDWDKKAIKCLKEFNLLQYYKKDDDDSNCGTLL